MNLSRSQQCGEHLRHAELRLDCRGDRPRGGQRLHLGFRGPVLAPADRSGNLPPGRGDLRPVTREKVTADHNLNFAGLAGARGRPDACRSATGAAGGKRQRFRAEDFAHLNVGDIIAYNKGRPGRSAKVAQGPRRLHLLHGSRWLSGREPARARVFREILENMTHERGQSRLWDCEPLSEPEVPPASEAAPDPTNPGPSAAGSVGAHRVQDAFGRPRLGRGEATGRNTRGLGERARRRRGRGALEGGGDAAREIDLPFSGDMRSLLADKRAARTQALGAAEAQANGRKRGAPDPIAASPSRLNA